MFRNIPKICRPVCLSVTDRCVRHSRSTLAFDIFGRSLSGAFFLGERKKASTEASERTLSDEPRASRTGRRERRQREARGRTSLASPSAGPVTKVGRPPLLLPRPSREPTGAHNRSRPRARAPGHLRETPRRRRPPLDAHTHRRAARAAGAPAKGREPSCAAGAGRGGWRARRAQERRFQERRRRATRGRRARRRRDSSTPLVPPVVPRLPRRDGRRPRGRAEARVPLRREKRLPGRPRRAPLSVRRGGRGLFPTGRLRRLLGGRRPPVPRPRAGASGRRS